MDQTTTKGILQAIEILRSAKSLFVLTGAGISSESGVPTFRGQDGLWKDYSATDLATPEAFNRDPKLVWEWYHWRQSIILAASPNTGHNALVELEQNFDDFLLLTQNVDNLHRQAGSRKLLELHGNIFRARCLGCGETVGHSSPDGKPALPLCPHCGGPLRPDIVWFGEAIPQDIWRRAISFLNDADAAMIIGTSSVVWPAAYIPEICRQNGVRTIEINLEPTPVSDLVDLCLFGKSGEILPEIAANL